ncbi:uncharacterized protein BX664DRAFT_386658 [Halteromyces radiatus]|uniref:uncharacterized protein n=1 Tax=Halteromyces radiatus TaxID=101107 RepID=UPI002220EBF5|nr:uncharacterized protein BX664DRAFT_386658 [Halteromyces radiatus]KAI8086217.1 hypothetical protein BX664DRAFT_386658 [Halteromyces radiatus]
MASSSGVIKGKSFFFALFIFSLILLFVTVDAQGISKTGKKDGTNTYKHAKDIQPGTYHIRNVKSKKYLAFLPGTLVEPTASSKSDITEWSILKYKTKMYSINHDHGTLKKCVSARWTNGKDDAGVMWQCELKYGHKKRSSLSKRYEPILWQKQTWLFVPVNGKKNTFRIMAVTHMYDMIPTCLSSSSTGGKSYRGGTVLKKCKYNTNDPSLFWTFEKA